MVVIKNLIDSQFITEVLGLGSNIYLKSIKVLKKKSKNNQLYEEKFLDWKNFFTNLYGYEITSELFLKHTYFSHILKIIVISKVFSEKKLDLEDIFDEYCKHDVNKIFETEYFFWTQFDINLFQEIYKNFQGRKFGKEDLFNSIYQQIFLHETRHRIGEFFTPSDLVDKMVDDSYKVGSKVLDPSCGSGNFIINIIIKIIDSKEPLNLKYKAISNVFGFDINPLAVMTVNVNTLLLLLEYFNKDLNKVPNFNVFLIDSLFPGIYEKRDNIYFNNLFNSFDLVIGNPPWLTYKDLNNKTYQNKIRNLAKMLKIKPPSQYITHIELATIFFYAIPSKFLKKHGTIFFVMPKSVLNGDHCYKFRAFSIFNKNLEIWDFPKNYFFNVNHICLKAEYIGPENQISINERYPIKTKLFNNEFNIQKETRYSSLKIEDEGAKLIFPEEEFKLLNTTKKSPYKDQFFQGATLVPRSLVFFKIEEKSDDTLIISSDSDILSRAKKKWEFQFYRKEIEKQFRFNTFLNKDLVPFFIKSKKNVFLPVNEQFEYDGQFLLKYEKSLEFYKEINAFYQQHKKETSTINTLYANLNYWNKLKKQINNKSYIVVYNASGSILKAAVVNNEKQRVIIGSENYYYSTNSQNEAYYLCSILNSPILSKNIKIIKSSRHIHKRPFMFPIPIYDENNILHIELARKGRKCENVVQDLYLNNPKINSEKVRIFINQRLLKLDKLTNDVVFN